MTAGAVDGCRVLVIEDEAMVALLIEDALAELSCTVVGPTGRLDTAMRLAEEGAYDAAILDVTVRGGKSFPVAEYLQLHDIPFIFAIGYSDWSLPAEFRDLPRLAKPFTMDGLKEKIRSLRQEVFRRRPTPAR